MSMKKAPPGHHAGKMDPKPVNGITPSIPDEGSSAPASSALSAKSPVLKRIALLILFALCLHGCGSEEPVRIGFLGSITGPFADIGISSRDAVLLAVDQCNAQGGIRGRKVVLMVRDDKRDVDSAKKAVQELILAGAQALIGPMNNEVTLAVIPYLDSARMPAVSPTVTTARLSGLDDYFFRVCMTNAEYAPPSARYALDSMGMRRIAVACDDSNISFSRPWLDNFRTTLIAGGGEILATIAFKSIENPSFSEVARRLLEMGADGILIIAGPMESAMLCQKIRQSDPSVKIGITNWGATGRFIELGGRATEGVFAPSAVLPDSPNKEYQLFRKIYSEKYRREPNFGSVLSYDAARVVLTALNSRKRGQGIKETILSTGEFNGLQSKIRFDAYGDVRSSATFIKIVRNQKFIAAE